MKISHDDVLAVALLAHLDLSPGEVETYRGQLDEILNYVDKLKQLDVGNVEPMAQVLFEPSGEAAGLADLHSELRDDVPRPCTVAGAILGQSVDAAKPFFRVPKVIDR